MIASWSGAREPSGRWAVSGSCELHMTATSLTRGDCRETVLSTLTEDLTNLTRVVFIKRPETGAVDYVSFRRFKWRNDPGSLPEHVGRFLRIRRQLRLGQARVAERTDLNRPVGGRPNRRDIPVVGAWCSR